MPSNRYSSPRTSKQVAYRYHTDIPAREYVSWNFTKLLWLVFVVSMVLGLIFLPHVR